MTRTTIIKSIARVVLGLGVAALGWSQEVVKPDAPEAAQKAQPNLSANEREFLLSLTRKTVGPETEGEAPAARHEGAAAAVSEAALVDLVEQVDQLLARVSATGSAADQEVMLTLMGSPLAEIRITALNWVVGSEKLAADALIQAIQDRDDEVRESAFTHLVNMGIDAKSVGEMKTKIKDPESSAGVKSDLRVAVRRAHEAAKQRGAK